MIGNTLGHYRILEKLGGGGMGVVYRAHDERLDRDVALKVLPAGMLADESARRRFRKEALTLSQLNHPNIAVVHDFDTQEGVDFLAMEYVAGETLAQKLAAGPLPEKEVLALATQIAEALEEAYEHDIIHRDLKPGNVMLTPKGRVKVVDFGLAKLVKPVEGDALTAASLAETQAGAVTGTVPYMAPEQLQGKTVDARADVYALGAVLYEMATGRRPFPETQATRLVSAILTQTPQPPREVNGGISSGLESVILKALEKDPENRYQSAKELLADLRRLSAAQTAPAQSLLARRRALAVVVLLVVGVTAGIGIWYHGHSRPMPTAPQGKPSLAVLPFQNLSPEPENEYFSDGMTEELITKLSRIQNLQVAARTSVARYKNTQKDAKEIGQELGVRYVVEGSVRKAGNRVRITAQLIDASTGFHLWADDFDGELKNVFEAQDQTALKIAYGLNLRLSPQEQQAVRRRYTQNPQAYDACLRGWALAESFSGSLDRPEKLEAARKHFEQALGFDPEYPLALAGLSEVEGLYYFFNIERTPDHLRRSEELARRALALDPQLPEAHVAIGDVYGALRNDFVRAVEEYRQALQLDPLNAYAWEELAWALNSQQPPDPKEGEKAAREAIRIQPLWFWNYYQLGWALRLQARYEEAIATFEHALQLNPDFGSAYVGLGEVYLDQGNYNQALAQLNKARRMGETPERLVLISAAYAGRGDIEKSIAELVKALARGYRDFAYLESSPYFAQLRTDPHYQKLLQRYRK